MTAYWIAHVTIHDLEQYQQYMALAREVFKNQPAEFIAREENSHTLEGTQYQRHVIIKFPDLDSALACYHSAEYQAAKQKRDGCCDVMITIVNGLPT